MPRGVYKRQASRAYKNSTKRTLDITMYALLYMYMRMIALDCIAQLTTIEHAYST